MRDPELHVKLPSDLPSDHYEGLRAAVSSLLELWGVRNVSPLLVDLEPGRAEAAVRCATEGEPDPRA